MIRVRYTRHGSIGSADFHCIEDARRFMDWGVDHGIFISPRLWPRHCHDCGLQESTHPSEVCRRFVAKERRHD